MELKQLEAFSQVIALRSLTKAAEALGVSQPTITNYLMALEAEFNCELLVRTSTDVVPTEQGARLLAYALRFRDLARETTEAITVSPDSYSGELTIAASSVPAEYFLPEVLKAFHNDYPDITYRIHSCNSMDVIEEVKRGHADVGLTGTSRKQSSCTFLPFADDRLVLIAPAVEPYLSMAKGAKGSSSSAKGKKAAVAKKLPVFPSTALAAEKFIVREKGSGTRIEGEQALAAAGVDISSVAVAAEVPQAETIKMLVGEGMGVALISEHVVAREVEQGTLLAFSLEGPIALRELYLVTRQTQSKQSLAHLFTSFAQRSFAG